MLQKRNLFILLLFLTLTFSFSQERIGSFKNDLKISSSFIKEIIPIANSKTMMLPFLLPMRRMFTVIN